MKVTKSGVTVRYYPTPKGKTESWTVCWQTPAGRKRQRKANEKEALKFAIQKADDISRGMTKTISAEDRASLDRCIQLLKPHKVNFESAVIEYVELVKMGNGVPPLEMGRYYISKHAHVASKPVSEVVDEMIIKKRQDGLSDSYLRDLETRLNRFKADIRMPIGNVTAPLIDDWLRSLHQFQSKTGKSKTKKPLEFRGRNNYRAAICALLSFAKSRKYLPRDYDEMSSIPVVKGGFRNIAIFTPDEMRKLLKIDPRLRAFIAIGGFAGLRSSEIQRLHWHSIDLERGFIRADQHKGNTPSRRLVPILPNLKSWLLTCEKRTGPVCCFAQVVNRVTEYTRKPDVNIPWKHNALRHSFISYRVAEIKNVNQVALEAGNSPAKVFSNYRELVTPEQAKEWFSILP